MVDRVTRQPLAKWMICLAVLAKLCVGLGSYSGMSTPPKYGDYEAQRHWMEITINLTPSQWYVNSTENDLMYWGLDYPPLSGYQSWLHAKFLAVFDPSSVALMASRGHESPLSKLLMRSTVVLSDAVVLIPASLLAVAAFASFSPELELAVHLLLCPALLLIDHGHFQFNGINLGLVALAAAATVHGRPVMGAVCYSLALNHKQMTLYFAPAFFTHMLGLCLQCRPFVRKLGLFAALGAAVIATFSILWLPVIRPPSSLTAVLNRVFPTQRGLFEDYVANIWCVSSLAIKWRRLLGQGQLLALCALCTLCALVPAVATQLVRPTRRGLVLALANSSLAFFLFGYQVHEKSVLLPLLPLCLLGGGVADLAQYVAVFSMLPLLRKDGLGFATFACMAWSLIALLGIFVATNAQQWAEFRSAAEDKKVM